MAVDGVVAALRGYGNEVSLPADIASIEQAMYRATYWSRSIPRYWNLRKVLFFFISAAASASCIAMKG